MPERHLRQLLTELHRELEEGRAFDAETRELLGEARDEIEEALEAAGADAPRGPLTARERMEQTVRRFERSHPEAVALLQRVLDALSNVGI